MEELIRLRSTLARRYAVERELGRGGMATVYLAQDLKHERPVAIKVLHPELAAVLGPERFLREIKLTAGLNHPHILPLLDSGEAGGFLYYVMPYMEGESLRDRLNREKQLPVDDALQIAREVADALDYAHQHAVVHRDIKPENVLLQGQHAVVADFGIARAIGVAGGERLTATGVAVGTPEYMSPEQASGRSEVDGRSDVYALGCVVYEMLAGHPPFTGTTAHEVLARHAMDPVPPLRSARGTVPEALSRTIERALAKTPADRFASAGQFTEAIAQKAPPLAATWRSRLMAVLLAMVILAAAGTWVMAGRGRDGRASATGSDLPRLVVLPFENLGAPEDEYFADGMTEEITSRLAQVRALAVIGRTSALQYKDGGKPLRTIGDELRVQYILEGTVRWSAEGGESRVRITPQLIRVSDETHVWAERYDAVLADVFAVQGRIATQVAAALSATLGPNPGAVTDLSPLTRIEPAYQAYLRGNALYGQCTTARPCAVARQAAQHYREAVRLDTAFGAAWARLNLALSTSVGLNEPIPPLAWEAARRAVHFTPDIPEALVAYASVFSARGPEPDLDREEATYRQALDLQPNHPDALRALGLLLRRGGNMRGGVELLARLADLDPRDGSAQVATCGTYTRLRRFDEAEPYCRQFIALAPGDHQGYQAVAIVRLGQKGDSMAARRVMQAAPGSVDFHRLHSFHSLYGFTDLDRLLCDKCANAAQNWLTRAGTVPDDSATEWHPVLHRGWVARLAQDSGLARSFLEEAARRGAARSQSDLKEDDDVHWDLGAILTMLGRKEEAIRAARAAVRLRPISQDATNGPARVNTLAEVYATFGEDRLALEQLEILLSTPSFVSVPLTRVNPVWRRFEGDPRFQALLAKYEKPFRN